MVASNSELLLSCTHDESTDSSGMRSTANVWLGSWHGREQRTTLFAIVGMTAHGAHSAGNAAQTRLISGEREALGIVDGLTRGVRM